MAQTVAPVAADDGPAKALAPAAPLTPRRLDGWRFPLAVALASRVLALAAMAVVALVKWPAGASLSDALLAPLGAWDGEWYARIAEHGYDPTLGHGNAAAFFPLYPSLIAALHDVLPFVDVIVLGAVISNVAFVAGILLLWRLTRERFGDAMARRVTWYVSFAPVAFVFSTMYTEGLFLLLVVGTFLETVPALLILSPILLPVVKGLGIDPVHFGVIISYNLILGIIHPPLGIGLFVAARVARITPEQVLSATWPFFIPLIGGLLIISAVPELSLWLPNTVYAWLGLK